MRREDATGRRLERAPLLVVEVLSPSTRTVDLVLKRRVLEEAGVPSYWLVDPDDGVGMVDGVVPLGSGLGGRLITALTQQLGGTLTRSGPGTRWTIRFPRDAPGAVSL